MLTVTHPICEYQTNPLGIGVLEPRLSWKLESTGRGIKQSAYQVLAASSQDLLTTAKADIWNSGKQDTDQSIHVRFKGSTPSSRQRIYWQVTVWDNQGQTAHSEIAWFEMGLLDKSD